MSWSTSISVMEYVITDCLSSESSVFCASEMLIHINSELIQVTKWHFHHLSKINNYDHYLVYICQYSE